MSLEQQRVEAERITLAQMIDTLEREGGASKYEVGRARSVHKQDGQFECSVSAGRRISANESESSVLGSFVFCNEEPLDRPRLRAAQKEIVPGGEGLCDSSHR